MQDSEFAKVMLDKIEKEKPKNKQDIQRIKMRLSQKYGFKQMISNPTILSFAENKTTDLVKLLGRKPVKSLSGISIVSLMTSPHPCPGKCIYCPSSLVEKATPKAYTGKEPTTMRAIRHNYDPKKQVEERIKQLSLTGHSTQKIELIVMGGTFLSQGIDYQKYFVKNMLDGVTQNNSNTWQEAVTVAETSKNRAIGMTFETRPDWCSEKDIERMLYFGGTRVELGTQILDDYVNAMTKRGHSIEDTIKATAHLKDSGFKVCHHLMPGLPYSNLEKDYETAIRTFTDPSFKPDMVKFYPCLVIENTPLFDAYKRGEFKPMENEEAAELLARVLPKIPNYIRINRIQRDIPAPLISGGVKRSDLRELVDQKLRKKGKTSNDIRSREAGLKTYKENLDLSYDDMELLVEKYPASKGTEYFISFEDVKHDVLYGFTRLRIPHKPFMPQITERTSLIRELRIFGKALDIGEKSDESSQHHGLGEKLIREAEKIAFEDESCNKMAVIAGLGVKEYYIKKFNYIKDGPYVSGKLGK